jgi:hypothetical protein
MRGKFVVVRGRVLARITSDRGGWLDSPNGAANRARRRFAPRSNCLGRTFFNELDETTRGHVFCSFLVLVLKKALEGRNAKLGPHRLTRRLPCTYQHGFWHRLKGIKKAFRRATPSLASSRAYRILQ